MLPKCLWCGQAHDPWTECDPTWKSLIAAVEVAKKQRTVAMSELKQGMTNERAMAFLSAVKLVEDAEDAAREYDKRRNQ